MQPITQPITVTDMRRDPKALLKRVKKEGVVPILVHSGYPAAVIAIEKLNELYDMIRELKHEIFVQETLEVEKEFERNGGSGPFNSVDEFMEHITKVINEGKND